MNAQGDDLPEAGRDRAPPYARELRGALPHDLHAPVRARLAWLPVHLLVIAAMITVLAPGWVPLYVAPLLSVVIGMSFAGLTFLAHETLHGSVVRGKRARYLVGWLGFLPFAISPRLWVAWHNRVHHGHTNQPGTDPDANPTLTEYRGSARVRAITDHFALGRQSWSGFIGLLVGFSIQSAHVLSFAGRREYLSARQHRLALAETTLAVAVWATLLVVVGPLAFVFAFFLPLLVANAIVMGFIFTNHGLSPLTSTNDALVGTLSVTTPRLIEWVTLGFGYHTEHHLFPGMSSRHARRVRELLRERWPERYQSMPLWRALLAMHHSGRVYRDDTTLIDPRSGMAWSALLPTRATFDDGLVGAPRPLG
jgi:fatty acid desaturase